MQCHVIQHMCSATGEGGRNLSCVGLANPTWLLINQSGQVTVTVAKRLSIQIQLVRQHRSVEVLLTPFSKHWKIKWQCSIYFFWLSQMAHTQKQCNARRQTSHNVFVVRQSTPARKQSSGSKRLKTREVMNEAIWRILQPRLSQS